MQAFRMLSKRMLSKQPPSNSCARQTYQSANSLRNTML
jgi:hypothetical protein